MERLCKYEKNFLQTASNRKGTKIVNQETKPSSTEDVIDEDNQSDEEEVEEPVAKKPKKGKVPATTADEEVLKTIIDINSFKLIHNLNVILTLKVHLNY